MLSYVFWHRPRPEVDRGAYEESLVAFQTALAAARPQGFLGAASYRVRGAPWIGGEAYEDRYLVSGSAALDTLNDAAVSGASRVPHDAAARATGGGTAGLYRLAVGEPGLAVARRAFWFAKPARMSYEELDGELVGAAADGSGLWRRQLVLGPTPELCLLTPAEPRLPTWAEPLEVELELVCDVRP